MSIQLKGNDDSVFTSDVLAPNIPTQGQIVGYQQGNYSPEPLLGTVTFVSDRCYWVRVGNKVTINGAVTDISNTSSGDGFRITQLPYPCSAESYGGAMATRIATTIGSTSCQVSASFVDPDSRISFYVNAPAPGNSAKVIVHSDIDSNTASTVYWQLNYLTDDTTWTPINGATVS